MGIYVGSVRERSRKMYLFLLAFTYAVDDRKAVEEWLSQAGLDSVLLSTERYNDEILAVLANYQEVTEDGRKLHLHPAISSCIEKQCPVTRVVTTIAPEQVLRSFPLREGEEWYLGSGHTAYLCTASRWLSDKQISWLATCTTISAWDYVFDLTPMPAGC
jgi:hypothetical protein